MEGFGRHRPVPLGHEDVRGYPLFALQAPQGAYLIRNSIQPQRFRCVPVSARRTRSPSVTIPTRAPRASTTGKPLNLRSSIRRMASVIEASGEMHTGSGVMTSAALMASPPHLNFAHI